MREQRSVVMQKHTTEICLANFPINHYQSIWLMPLCNAANQAACCCITVHGCISICCFIKCGNVLLRTQLKVSPTHLFH